MIKLSLTMPVYNGARYLAATLDSILAQTFERFELVAVDDGSTDESVAILEAYAARDRRIRVVRHERNLGHLEASNHAMRLGHGEYLARHDQDDVSMPERLESQVAHLDRDAATALVSCAYYRLTPSGAKRLRTPPEDHAGLCWKLLFDNCLAHSSLVFRRALFESDEPVYANLPTVSDYDLCVRLGRRGRLHSLPTPLLVYREHPGGMMTAFRATVDELTSVVSIRQLRELLPTWGEDDLRALRGSHGSPWLSPAEIRAAARTGELRHAFGALHSVTPERMRQLEREWIRRTLKRVPAREWRQAGRSGLLSGMMRAQPGATVATAATELLRRPIGALYRQMRGAASPSAPGSAL